jgi:hypothetical protein
MQIDNKAGWQKGRVHPQGAVTLAGRPEKAPQRVWNRITPEPGTVLTKPALPSFPSEAGIGTLIGG